MTEKIEIEAATFDTMTCPDCGAALESHYDMEKEGYEQIEGLICPDCSSQFEIKSVSYLSRKEES